MIEDPDGNLWLAADFVLAKFDPETEEFTYYKPESDERRLSTLYLDGSGVLWIGGSEGLYQFDPQTEVFTLHRPGSPIMVDDILANDDGTMWVSTEGNGLYLFDPLTGRFGRHYRHDATDTASLSHDQLPDLYRDRAGVLWIASDKGINLYDPGQRQFAYYRSDPGNDQSLGAGMVWGMAGGDGRPGSGGDLWLGSGTNLNRFDLATGGVIRYPLGTNETDSRTLPSGAIYYDSAGFVWVGNGPWLYRLNETSGEIQSFDLNTAVPPGSPPAGISALYRDGPALLIAARPDGLFRFDLQSETFEPYLAPPPEHPGTADPRFYLDQEISTLYGDRDGAIWLGYSTGGISRLDPNTGTFRHYVPDPNDPPSIPEAWIVSMVQDRDGILWLASWRGLIRFDPLAETFRTYTEKDGLLSAHIAAIQQDQSGALWLATSRGLSRFDPQTETFRTYDVDDGVGSTEFSRASWQSADGRLFFGGDEGLTAFYPDQIADDVYRPPVVLTTFYLFHEPVAIGPNSLLQQPIWETEHLTLQHDQTSISFEFAALSYAASHKNRYRYTLEGAEKEWHEVDSAHRLATYTNLSTGEYIFRVQGSNKDGIWSDEEVVLPITIIHAWWQTWWFRGSALILLLGLVAAGVRWRTSTLEQRSRILEAEVAERTRELATRTERLQESEKRFRDLTELLPGAIVEMDADFTVTYMNRAGIKMFGYTQEAIQAGLNGMDVIHPQDREKAARRVARHLAGEDVPPIEYRMLRKDGTEVPVLFKAAPIRQEGETRGFRASITDISNLKEAEKAVRQSEQQLRFITDSVPAYVAYVGLDDLRYRLVSRRFEQAYKMPRENIIGKHIKDVIGESNYLFALKYIDEVRSGRATSYENVFDVAEGKRWIEINYVPTFDERGEPEGITVLSFDITERKRAEEALRESQEQFALFMDRLPHGVFIKEEDSTVIYINQYIKDVLGGEHWLGRDAHAAFPEYPDPAEAMMADDRSALAQGQTRVEEAMPDKDGNERVFVTT
jgi:PAS domain S-box-containing protein